MSSLIDCLELRGYCVRYRRLFSGLELSSDSACNSTVRRWPTYDFSGLINIYSIGDRFFFTIRKHCIAQKPSCVYCAVFWRCRLKNRTCRIWPVSFLRVRTTGLGVSFFYTIDRNWSLSIYFLKYVNPMPEKDYYILFFLG